MTPVSFQITEDGSVVLILADAAGPGTSFSERNAANFVPPNLRQVGAGPSSHCTMYGQSVFAVVNGH